MSKPTEPLRQKKPKNDSVLDRFYQSAMFRVLIKIIRPLGYSWIKGGKKSHLEVDMAYTSGIEWRGYVAERYLILVPMDNVPFVKQIHYSFPFPFGIWLHRTIQWNDGRTTHERLKGSLSTFMNRKYDISKDYLKFKDRQFKKLHESSK